MASNALPTLLLGVSLSLGCAANHALPHTPPPDVPDLVDELSAKSDDAEALFDLRYLPLLHLDLQTFTPNEGAARPEGHEFFSIRSWLPLFLVVDGAVAYFDREHATYERSEFAAILWGLWARVETTVQTRHGARVERRGRLLWFLDWDDSVAYRRP